VFRGRVLVIDGDDWLRQVLARELEERAFAVDHCGEAREGFQKAFDTIPDCVVCSVDLPDIDGFWFARRVRTEGGPIAKIPILLLGTAGDKEARLQGLQVGADVVLERPLANAEIALQTEALVAFARRVRGPEVTEEPSAPSLAAAFRGDLSTFPLASILMMLEMERRTGTLEVVTSTKDRASLVLSTGLFASTDVNGASKPPVDALREVLSWRSGRFAFRPREVGSLPPPRGSVGALVLEAMRLEDESKAAR
jgi:two-component system, OmpR family, response regulator